MFAHPKCFLFAGLLASAAPVASAQTAFTPGNLVLVEVGDGTTPLANTGGPLSLLEYSPTGTLAQTVAVSTSTTAGLQISGSAASEGAI